MRKRPLLALASVAACQTGEPPPTVTRKHVEAQVVVSPTTADRATPMQIAATVQPATPVATAPFSLTASDGSGLAVTRIDAKAIVQGPLAFTELHLYFKNPEHRTREGTFAITLPSGAAVSRFAMEIDGSFQEAEVVEKQVARRIYDDFLHRKQDPALLEKGAGNQFSAKVFPIPANAEKHLVVSFSQELAGRDYVLPLRGLPRTARVDAQLTLTGSDGKPATQRLAKRDWQPDIDFTAASGTPAAGVSSGELVVSAITLAPRGDVATSAPTAMTLLVDTSASRALGFARYIASVQDLVSALRTKWGDIALQVVAFDQDTQVIFEGPATAYGSAHEQALLARGAAGASDLAHALASLAAPRRRVVIVTDAVVTAGPEATALADTVHELAAERVDVVLTGGIRDERTAATIVRAGLPQAGDVFDLDTGVAAVATGLGETVLTDIAIDVPGATWVYPRAVPAARPGSPLMVYARMPRPTQQLTISVGGARRTLGLGSAAPALVERAIASAEIEELENKLAGTRDDAEAKLLRKDIAQRSVKSRIVSSQASMIVLESEADYQRYEIPRTALADILVVGPHGLEQQKRSATFIAQAPRTTAPATAREQAIEHIRSAGILGEPGAAGAPGAFASLTADGDISSGLDDANVYGGLIGNETGEMQGGFGFGRSGSGPGGGGTGWATIGTGRYGSIGHGSGTGVGYGVSSGRGAMRGRTASVPDVRVGQPTVAGNLDRAIIRRYVRRNIQKLRYCYEKELLHKPNLAGAITTRFVIGADGKVKNTTADGVDSTVAACVRGVLAAIEFPRPTAGMVQVTYPLMFGSQRVARPDDQATTTLGWGAAVDAPEYAPPGASDDGDHSIPALAGKLADVMKALRAGSTNKAHELASAWHADDPGDVLALIALGETLEKKQDVARAARMYGSIIDLYPNRADMRRFAGQRLERLGRARPLIVDTYRRAVEDRPDHATGHRLLAYALVRSGDLAGAFAAILNGVDRDYPADRFAGADRVLREDAEMIAAAYLAKGGPRDSIMAELTKRTLEAATAPSTRFIMYWETDSNDVDFHIKDARGGHAWYQYRHLRSGGELYADVTTGYGPECFAIPGTPSAGPYRLSINYYSQGPMGYGMGLLQIQRFTGKGFTFEDRPYVVMNDGAFVELGSYR